jgi:osmotically-inducible protein OsmY
MRIEAKVVVLVVLVALALSGCVALTGSTLGQNIDDTTITTTVKAKLAGEKAVTLTRVSVETQQGVVYLTGFVESAALRDRAGEIARKVDGVRDVVNNVRVQ